MSMGPTLTLLHIYKSLGDSEYVQGIPGRPILHLEAEVMT